ncbi:phosphate acetyltransferase [Natroniella sp. ANB-PHB2]|uniref:phosphate acetyltransferase n=1 Tax=Natroniella sp. ANB-PHB2 TaxID=3384444 RepID=UPI0038D49AD0
MSFISNIYQQARQKRKKIVLPEGADARVVEAVPIILEKGVADIVLLGEEKEIQDVASECGTDLTGVEIINPVESDKLEEYSQAYYQLREHKGITLEEAREKVTDPLYFASLMVEKGDADGKVAGAVAETGKVLRAALRVIGTAPGISVISGAFIMIVKDKDFGDGGLLVFGDCAVNPNPTSEQLAEIAVSSARTADSLVGIDPQVAMLSFSTNGSAKHEMSDKVRNATGLARELAPELKIDGEMQADAAIISKVAEKKYPESDLAGHANVLIFPDLQSGNIGYKLVERFAQAEAIGPVLQGIAKPVNDLSRGCCVQDIVNVTAITAVQAQK